MLCFCYLKSVSVQSIRALTWKGTFQRPAEASPLKCWTTVIVQVPTRGRSHTTFLHLKLASFPFPRFWLFESKPLSQALRSFKGFLEFVSSFLGDSNTVDSSLKMDAFRPPGRRAGWGLYNFRVATEPEVLGSFIAQVGRISQSATKHDLTLTENIFTVSM